METRATTIRLGREVRFALTADPAIDAADGAVNNYAGFPRPAGVAPYYRVTAELAGMTDPRTSCVANIKLIDDVVRAELLRAIRSCLAAGQGQPGQWLVAGWAALADRLAIAGRARLDALIFDWTPFHRLTYRGEHDMGSVVYLTEQFEFSAAHRLWSATLSDAENQGQFGKCANPAGHGHNYVVEVTVKSPPAAVTIPALERIVKAAVIDRLDHRNLNVDCEEFRSLNPTVENICSVIFGILSDASALGGDLVSVRLYETPKTYAECRQAGT
ncbi:MAG: 6-carboxytetrahydropterin synthase [Phycisphaerae bacterium]|nr:6-carboxytetrahydropterin synthase [Phycisphaerae bacterium]